MERPAQFLWSLRWSHGHASNGDHDWRRSGAAAGYNYPFLVQWQKNQVDIPGATGKTLKIANVKPANSVKYRAVVSAPSGNSVPSVEVSATVIADKIPSTVVSALRSFAGDTKVLVPFSEPVSSGTATTVGNYKINIVDPTHPLAAGFPAGPVTTSASETYSHAQSVNAAAKFYRVPQ